MKGSHRPDTSPVGSPFKVGAQVRVKTTGTILEVDGRGHARVKLGNGTGGLWAVHWYRLADLTTLKP